MPSQGFTSSAGASQKRLALVLAPLHREAGLARVIVSTYQAASGAGQRAMEELREILDARIEPGEVSFAGTLSDKEDFLQAIKQSRETLEPVEVGHRTVSLCQIGLIAIKLGRALRWDPAAERFLDDNAANAMLTRPVRDPWGI